MKDMQQQQQHIVMFPFLAQGHLIPFLALANLIEQRRKQCTTIVTLVTTPLNILKLKPLLPPTSSIRLAQLPFSSSDHGLPPDSENTDVLPLHLIVNLFNASETLQPSFELLLFEIVRESGRQNVSVVADMFLGWTLETAEKLGVPHTVFVTCGAYGGAIYSSLWLHPPRSYAADDDDTAVPLLDYPEVEVTPSQISHAIISGDRTDPMTTFLRRQLSLSFSSGGILLNTVEELEKTGLSMLRRSPGLRVWAVGPLLSPPSSHCNSACDIMKWLDCKPPASVVYVSFGSQNTVAATQMMELALGLEASGKHFIWVVRPPNGFQAIEGEFRSAEWLPEGFEDRMREQQQGLLVHRWAPQLDILSRVSTGAFISHCGWNSVMESLSRGVPIMGWPLLGDQLYNCKMMVEELGVCVEIASGMSSMLDDGWRTVERAIGLVMGEASEKGREMRRRAEEISEVLKGAMEMEDGGSSLKALDDFYETTSHLIMRERPITAGNI